MLYNFFSLWILPQPASLTTPTLLTYLPLISLPKPKTVNSHSQLLSTHFVRDNTRAQRLRNTSQPHNLLASQNVSHLYSSEFLQLGRQSASKWDEVSIFELEHHLYLSNDGPLFLLNKNWNTFESTLTPSTILQIFKYVHVLLENPKYFFSLRKSGKPSQISIGDKNRIKILNISDFSLIRLAFHLKLSEFAELAFSKNT